jgi:hypothetical protein
MLPRPVAMVLYETQSRSVLDRKQDGREETLNPPHLGL